MFSTFSEPHILKLSAISPIFTRHMLYDALFSQTHQKQRKRKVRSKFTANEDFKLKSLVAEYGENRWDKIAEHFKTRNARQCHDRWNTYLAPSIKHDPWTEEDDKLLLEKYTVHGPCWVRLKAYFPNRTDASLKNRFNVLRRRMPNTISFVATPFPTPIHCQNFAPNIFVPFAVLPPSYCFYGYNTPQPKEHNLHNRTIPLEESKKPEAHKADTIESPKADATDNESVFFMLDNCIDNILDVIV